MAYPGVPLSLPWYSPDLQAPRVLQQYLQKTPQLFIGELCGGVFRFAPGTSESMLKPDFRYRCDKYIGWDTPGLT